MPTSAVICTPLALHPRWRIDVHEGSICQKSKQNARSRVRVRRPGSCHAISSPSSNGTSARRSLNGWNAGSTVANSPGLEPHGLTLGPRHGLASLSVLEVVYLSPVQIPSHGGVPFVWGRSQGIGTTSSTQRRVSGDCSTTTSSRKKPPNCRHLRDLLCLTSGWPSCRLLFW